MREVGVTTNLLDPRRLPSGIEHRASGHIRSPMLYSAFPLNRYGPALTHCTEKLELSLPSIEGTAFGLPLLSTMAIW